MSTSPNNNLYNNNSVSIVQYPSRYVTPNAYELYIKQVWATFKQDMLLF
jgi:hypothetical protein